ncbi:MAG TPA: ribbon-helix-helix domain-containing protein [Candidatus Acidoferrum sp.]
MKRTTINLHASQHKKLGILAKQTGATASSLVRMAVDEYLKKNLK